MRYIKEYFDYDNHEQKGKRWKIPLKMPDFIICLKKAGMNSEIQLNKWGYLLELKVFQKKDVGSDKKNPNITHIYLELNESGNFTWSPIYSYINQEEDDYSFKYMGELIATPEDIKEYNDEIEMKNDAENYNL